MSVQPIDNWFDQKIKLICDPYFDREFFTNLIFCIDRKKTIREVFESALAEYNLSPQFTDDFDRAILHLFYSHQAAQHLRENYQWLPLAQGLYTASLFRSNGRHPVKTRDLAPVEARGSSIEEFKKMIQKEARQVVPFEHAWESLIFLLQNRSTRPKAIELMVQTAVEESDRLTAELFTKAIDTCFAGAWKNLEVKLRRAFERLWHQGSYGKPAASLAMAKSLVDAVVPKFEPGELRPWPSEWGEELWFRLSKQSVESGWEWIEQISSQGARYEQVSAALQILFGRCLFAVKPEQWSLVSEAIIFSDCLQAAARWVPSKKFFYLAALAAELSRVSQVVAQSSPMRPTGASVIEKFSSNTEKNQLILRLDDAVETGNELKALDLLCILLKDRGYTHSLSDRLVMMGSKQDAWSFSASTIPVAFILSSTFESSVRLGLPEDMLKDAVYGLARFFIIQRNFSLTQVEKQGHYGDGGLRRSQFDVSGGARIVDRYVFNQMRNAQRIFVWPTEGKG